MHAQTCVVTLITKEEDGSIKVVMDNGHVMSTTTSTQATENGVRICLLSKTDTAQSSQIPITDFVLVTSTVPTTIQRGLHSLEEHGRNSNGGRCYDAYYKNIKLCEGNIQQGRGSIAITGPEVGGIATLDSFRLNILHRKQSIDHEGCLMRMLCDWYATRGFRSLRVSSVQGEGSKFYKSFGFKKNQGDCDLALDLSKGSWHFPLSNTPPFTILPVLDEEEKELRASLHAQGGHNQLPRVAQRARAIVVQFQIANGHNLYEFVQETRAGDPLLSPNEQQQLTWMEYTDNLAKGGTWGSHLEIASAAKVFEATIYVWKLTSGGYTYHSVHGAGPRVWHFGFEEELHYHLLIHGSDTDMIRRLVGYIAAVPSSCQTSTYRGSSTMILIGAYGDGACLFSVIGMAALACDHAFVVGIQPTRFSLLLTPTCLGRKLYFPLDKDDKTGKLTGANRQIDILCQTTGFPLVKGSVIFDGTDSHLMVLSGNPGVVHLACTPDERKYCMALYATDLLRKTLHGTGTNFKLLQHVNMSEPPDSYDGCTHVMLESASTKDVQKLLTTTSVNFVLVNFPAKQAEEPVHGFRKFKIQGLSKGNHSSGTESHVYMRTGEPGVSPTPNCKSVEKWIAKALKSPDSAGNHGNVLTTVIGPTKPKKFTVSAPAPATSTDNVISMIQYTVLPNVAATMRIASDTVTFLPGDPFCLLTSPTPLNFLGVSIDDKHNSLLLYNDHNGNFGAAQPNQVCAAFADQTSRSKTLGELVDLTLGDEQIAKAFRTCLKVRKTAIDAKQNLAATFLSVALTPERPRKKQNEEAKPDKKRKVKQLEPTEGKAEPAEGKADPKKRKVRPLQTGNAGSNGKGKRTLDQAGEDQQEEDNLAQDDDLDDETDPKTSDDDDDKSGNGEEQPEPAPAEEEAEFTEDDDTDQKPSDQAGAKGWRKNAQEAEESDGSLSATQNEKKRKLAGLEAAELAKGHEDADLNDGTDPSDDGKSGFKEPEPLECNQECSDLDDETDDETDSKSSDQAGAKGWRNNRTAQEARLAQETEESDGSLSATQNENKRKSPRLEAAELAKGLGLERNKEEQKKAGTNDRRKQNQKDEDDKRKADQKEEAARKKTQKNEEKTRKQQQKGEDTARRKYAKVLETQRKQLETGRKQLEKEQRQNAKQLETGRKQLEKQLEKERKQLETERKRNQKDDDDQRRRKQKDDDDQRKQVEKDHDDQRKQVEKDQEQKDSDDRRKQVENNHRVDAAQENDRLRIERKVESDYLIEQVVAQFNQGQTVMLKKLRTLKKNRAGEMEARITNKLDSIVNSKNTGSFETFTSEWFKGIGGITAPAFTALGNVNAAAWAATTAGHHLQSNTAAVAPVPSVPVDVLQHLKGKSMRTWTLDDVQQWLAAKNLQPLCVGAKTGYLDGEGLAMMMEQPKNMQQFVDEIWQAPVQTFHKELFKVAVKAFYDAKP
jgi:hypothetical protein